MKQIAIAIGALILGVVSILIMRAALLPGSASQADAPAVARLTAQRDGAAIAGRLAEAIRFETISWGGARPADHAAFADFAQFLEQTYPKAHAAMTREIVGGKSVVLRWKGSDAARKPIALLAHIDVVPVEPGTEAEWAHPPFAGVVAGGFVHGRGALDNKGQLIALMEAAEALASIGFEPAADIYFLFGHDEEVGGPEGAAAVSRLLQERGVRFSFTLDEGSGLVDGVVPGLARPIALIATAEKGSATLRLTATAQGGHSSAPGRETAVSLVSKAVVAANDNPHELEMDAEIVAFLHAVAGELSFAPRLVLANLWLTGPFVKSALARDPTIAAALRTTTAPTMIEGGAKPNILPQHASAVVNYRIHPRDSVDSVVARAERLMPADVAVELLGGAEPSPRSSTRSDAYAAIAQSTRAVFGDVAVAPFLTLQGTDTRNYVGLADDHYRFTPFIYRTDDLRRIHGTDERVAIDDLERAAAWYEDFIRKTAG